MIIKTYTQASDFLARAQEELERNEVLNSLLLGIALRLQKFPEHVELSSYLATVEDEERLLVAALMTLPFRLIIASNQFDAFGEAPSLLIQNLLEQGWSVPGVMGPSPLSDLFAQIWTSLTGKSSHVRRERLFELTHVIAPRPGPGSLRIATPDDIELVAYWNRAFQIEALHVLSITDEEALAWARTRIGRGEIFLWVLEDGTPVSLAGTTRPISRSISVGPVYTPPEQRGRGYASRSVAVLSQRLLDSGWERCSLFTDLANPTSNSIYQQLGYRPVQNFSEYSFSHT